MDERDVETEAARGVRRMRALAATIVPVAAFSFALGLTLPLVTLDRLYVFTERPSLLDIVSGLWTDGSIGLAAVVTLVSILFPAAKLLWLQLVAARVTLRGLDRLHALGRWSMMDVLVVALVVFAAKTSGLAAAVAEPGLWFYAAATLLAAVAAAMLERGGLRAGRVGDQTG